MSNNKKTVESAIIIVAIQLIVSMALFSLPMVVTVDPMAIYPMYCAFFALILFQVGYVHKKLNESNEGDFVKNDQKLMQELIGTKQDSQQWYEAMKQRKFEAERYYDELKEERQKCNSLKKALAYYVPYCTSCLLPSSLDNHSPACRELKNDNCEQCLGWKSYGGVGCMECGMSGKSESIINLEVENKRLKRYLEESYLNGTEMATERNEARDACRKLRMIAETYKHIMFASYRFTRKDLEEELDSIPNF